MKKILVAVFFVIAISLVAFLVVKENRKPTVIDGMNNAADKTNLIVLTNLSVNQKISNPLMIRGEARGYWFFEGILPVLIVDWDGKIIGQGTVQAKDEWMTTEFVPFSGTIEFDKSQISGNYSDRGVIIFQRANMSDLPENDDALEFPITFE